MNILFISSCYPSKDQPQYCIFLEQQAKALIDIGNSVSVLLPSQKEKDSSIVRSEYNDVDIYYLPYNRNIITDNGFISGAKKRIYNFLKENHFDIVALHIIPFSINREVVTVCNNLKINIVQHFHGLNIWHDYYPIHKIYENLILPFKIKMYKKLSAVICVSKSVEKVFKEKNKNVQTYVVYNGADIDKFKPNPKKHNDFFTILCVANLIPIKGQKYLIDAISILKKKGIKTQLLLVGEGFYRKELEERVKEMSCEDCISFLGVQSYDSVAKYMANADIFAFPSFFDACPCVLYEAMASGLLVISCNVYGSSEIILNNETGFLVDEKNAMAIADKIEYAIKNPKIVKKIICNGLAESRNRTWRNSAVILNESYMDITKQKN